MLAKQKLNSDLRDILYGQISPDNIFYHLKLAIYLVTLKRTGIIVRKHLFKNELLLSFLQKFKNLKQNVLPVNLLLKYNEQLFKDAITCQLQQKRYKTFLEGQLRYRR